MYASLAMKCKQKCVTKMHSRRMSMQTKDVNERQPDCFKSQNTLYSHEATKFATMPIDATFHMNCNVASNCADKFECIKGMYIRRESMLLLASIFKKRCLTQMKLAVASLTQMKLAVASLTQMKLAVASLTQMKLAVASLTQMKLAVVGLTQTKLAVASLTQMKLAVACLTQMKLAVASLTQLKLAVANHR